MLQIDLLILTVLKKRQYPEKKLRLKYVLRKSMSLEKIAALQVILASASAYKCSSKKFTKLNK